MKFNTNVGGVTVLFGSGTLANAELLRKSFSDRGVTRVVLVTTEKGDRRYGDQVRKSLGDLVVGTWKNAQPHVPQELVDALKVTAAGSFVRASRARFSAAYCARVLEIPVPTSYLLFPLSFPDYVPQ